MTIDILEWTGNITSVIFVQSSKPLCLADWRSFWAKIFGTSLISPRVGNYYSSYYYYNIPYFHICELYILIGYWVLEYPLNPPDFQVFLLEWFFTRMSIGILLIRDSYIRGYITRYMGVYDKYWVPFIPARFLIL